MKTAKVLEVDVDLDNRIEPQLEPGVGFVMI